MAARTRIIHATPMVGSVKRPNVPLETHAYFGPGYARCNDVTGAGSGQPFSTYKVTAHSGGQLTGKLGDYVFSNFTAERIRGETDMSGFSTASEMGLKSDSAYATDLVAKTNPSRPDVDLPVFIGELADLPSLVKDAGGKLLEVMARQHLRTHFGIIPLVKDLLSMLNFVSLSEARMKELRSLQRTGLRRTRSLGAYTRTASWSENMNSAYGWVQHNRPATGNWAVNVWGHVKWFPAANFPATDQSLKETAWKAVLGLTLDASTAWELIPFSWLFDWYGSIGSYLAATRNIVPCTHSTPQIMKHWKAECSVKLTAPVGCSTSDFFSRAERKERTLASPSPFTAHLPFLTGTQMAVLGSLTILRLGRYH